MTPYDNYEIHPCRRYEEPHKPGHFYFEQCEPAEADVWTLYGHCPEGGVEAIGDFATREDAERTFERIAGVPFGSHTGRLLAVRMLPRVLHALEDLMLHADEDCPSEYRTSHLSNAITEAMLVLECLKEHFPHVSER